MTPTHPAQIMPAAEALALWQNRRTDMLNAWRSAVHAMTAADAELVVIETAVEMARMVRAVPR